MDRTGHLSSPTSSAAHKLERLVALLSLERIEENL
ncbi:MAG: hypothetical protein ACI9WU_000729, partial [Myxococcota bacterium]